MAFSLAMPWSEGEEKMHRLMHVPEQDNPTSTMMTPQAAFMLQKAPLLALGTLDSQDRPWTTLLGGRSGFSQPLGGSMVGSRILVDGKHDPVIQELVGGSAEGELVQSQGAGKMLAGLPIDLMTRKRVKIFGRMVAGSLGEVDVEFEEGVERPEGAPGKQMQLQLVMKIEQSLGNCPKYLNQYEIRPALVIPNLLSKLPTLSPEGLALVARSDMFFLSTSTPEDMDTNHRGGPPGFVRVLSNDKSGAEIIYPEYSGNRLYQSLGNLIANPKIGITFPDYETGDVLYTTGSTEILVGKDAAALLPGSNLAVKVKLTEARFVQTGLPFRAQRKVPSPYNPQVRLLPSEGNIRSGINTDKANLTATLVQKTKLSPSVARFRFKVPGGIEYKPGQWVALDFSHDLNMGYSHMRDDDPRSLNDDFVRTFTISSSPAPGKGEGNVEKHFEITIRQVGPVTSYLFRQNDRAGFEIPILGVGGDFRVEQEERKVTPFIAGGVGITPLLGELPTLDLSPNKFKLLWTTRLQDIDFVLDILRRFSKLAACTELFFTSSGFSNEQEDTIGNLKVLGTNVELRRIEKGDLDKVQAETWYLCAAKPLRKQVLDWMGSKRVIFEDFDY